MSTASKPWNPRRVMPPFTPYRTSSLTVRVGTEQGDGYLKALSSKAEPHHLAAELVGTQLARWMKLPTLDYHIITLTKDDRIELADGSFAHEGPAFITRAEEGMPWGGRAEELELLANPEAIGRLIVFDTWTRNCDRYQPKEREEPRIRRDNVFFSLAGAPRDKFVLKAIDHGCCFTCQRDLTVKLAHDEYVRDNTLYGRFPEFTPRTSREEMLAIVAQVEAITKEDVEPMICAVPREWDLSRSVQDVLCEFICKRAKHISEIIRREWPRTGLFDDVVPGQESPQ